ncbi:MAG: fused DSP-PTPase phosphatase/NAD kinase-like protein [Pyrinomonadaceae bacterium]
MRRALAGFISVVVISLGLTRLGLGQDEPRYKELPNFHQVNSQLYRGGQPKPGGIQKLNQLGIKTVINLRDDDERALAEEQEARAAGLTYFNIPFKTWGGPQDEQVERVLALIISPANQPVFIHCRRGSDRTGTIMAIYRIEHDGWTSEQAKAEANRFGMGFWQVKMKDYIRDYYQRRLKRPAKVLPPGATPQHGVGTFCTKSLPFCSSLSPKSDYGTASDRISPRSLEATTHYKTASGSDRIRPRSLDDLETGSVCVYS